MPHPLARSLALGIAVLFAGCVGPIFAPQPLKGKPGDLAFAGYGLRDGDVIVSRLPTPASMIIARHGPTRGEFSHAAVFVYAPDGTGMIYHLRDGGGRILEAKLFLRSHELVGIYRHRRPDAPDILGPYIRTWVETHDIRTVPFALFPDPDHFNSPPYNCNTFVNSLYLGAGLEVPFVQGPPKPPGAWAKDLSRFFGSNWTRITSAGAVATNPNFREVGIWRNPAVDPRITAGLKGLTDAVRGEIEAGRRLNPHARRHMAQFLAKSCGQEDDQYANPRAMAVHFNLRDTWSQVHTRLRRLMYREGDAFTEAEAYDLARKLTLEHLDGVFEKPTSSDKPAP
jgi:hypothetical protein